jgi:hypothetical protein
MTKGRRVSGRAMLWRSRRRQVARRAAWRGAPGSRAGAVSTVRPVAAVAGRFNHSDLAPLGPHSAPSSCLEASAGSGRRLPYGSYPGCDAQGLWQHLCRVVGSTAPAAGLRARTSVSTAVGRSPSSALAAVSQVLSGRNVSFPGNHRLATKRGAPGPGVGDRGLLADVGQGRARTWPTLMMFGSGMWFRDASSATLVWNLTASTDRVSPERTV